MLVEILLCIFLCSTLSSVNAVDEPTSYRLLNNVIPLRYDIAITTYIHQMDTNFVGSVQIFIQVLNDTNTVVIHQQGLNIAVVRFHQLDNNSVPISTINPNRTYVSEKHFLVLETNLNQVLMKNVPYLIHIEYAGLLNSEPTGFYAASYTNANNQNVPSAMTNLKPNYARRMFPCFDEPHLKAIFSLFVMHGSNVTAISNMPGTRTELINDTAITEFLDTPKMSTYSVALIVSNLPNISSIEDSNQVMHKLYGRLEKSNQLDLLLQVSQKVLPTFNSILGVNHRLPELVQVALGNSNANPVSSWGVIAYRDSSIYFDSTDYFYQQEENIINQITNEIAKQFFGNTLSPHWWNSTWLLEGLTAVTANLVLNSNYSSYRSIDNFLINVKQNTMVKDANGDIPMLEYNVETDNQIAEIFTADTRNKAACILYMMMHAIREEVFYEGLTSYIVKNENSTITSFEFFGLLDTLARFTGTLSISTSIPNIINTWTSQKRLPILFVSRDNSSGSITVTQTTFGSTEPIQEWWSIPYNFVVEREAKLNAWLTRPDGWFDQQRHTVLIQPTAERNWSSTEWILFNKRSTGYYRVNYDRDNWYLLILYLTNRETFPFVHYLNRAQLINDAFIFAEENLLTYDVPLNLAQFLQHETEHFVWQSFYQASQFLERILFETDAYDQFSLYIRNLAGNQYDNFQRSNYHDVLTQKILINLLCRARYHSCVDETSRVVFEYVNDAAVLPQYLEEEYLNNGIRFLNVESFRTLFATAMAATDAGRRSLLFNGLGFTNNAENTQMLLNATITDNNQSSYDQTINMTSTERKIILQSLVNNNPVEFRTVLNFLRTKSSLYQRIMFSEIPDILQTISYRVGTFDSFGLFQVLVDTYGNLQNQATLNKYSEVARANVNWLDNRLEEIRKYIQSVNDNNNAVTLFATFSLLVISQIVLMFSNSFMK